MLERVMGWGRLWHVQAILQQSHALDVRSFLCFRDGRSCPWLVNSLLGCFEAMLDTSSLSSAMRCSIGRSSFETEDLVGSMSTFKGIWCCRLDFVIVDVICRRGKSMMQLILPRNCEIWKALCILLLLENNKNVVNELLSFRCCRDSGGPTKMAGDW